MPDTVDYLGVRVAALTTPQLIEEIRSCVSRGSSLTASYIHFHTVNVVRSNSEARAAFGKLDIVTPDGIAVLLTSRLFGRRWGRENIMAMEYVMPVLGPASIEHSWSLFLFGGAYEVAARAAEELKKAFPQINIVGTHQGYIESDVEMQSLISKISEARPTILLVGLGQPKQEEWMTANKHLLNANVIVGVGGYLEKLSTRIGIYPRWVNRTHFYWVYRLLSDPRRLWRRYTLGGLRFAAHVVRAKLESASKVYTK